MLSKVSYSSHYRAPVAAAAAARFSAPRSLIPSRPTLRPSIERWISPLGAFQKSVDSRGDNARVESDSGKVSDWVEKSQDELVYAVRSGVVKSTAPFGVFVDIGADRDALLPISQISSEIINEEDIRSIFSAGGDIKVMVLRIDTDLQRITLSTRSLEVNPGDMVKNPQLVYSTAEEAAAAFRAKDEAGNKGKEKSGEADANLKVHDLRSGVVQSVQRYGVFVDVGSGSIGLLHHKQISSDRSSWEVIGKMFRVGDAIKVMVINIDNDRHRISLSTKSLEVNPGDMVKNPQLVYSTAEEAAAAFRAKREVFLNLKVHELRSGVVQSVSKRGVYVDIGAGPIGLLHRKEISHKRVIPEDIEKMFSVGDEIKVVIHEIDKDRREVSLSTKSLEVNPGDMFKDPQLVYSTAEEAAAAFRAKEEVDSTLKVNEIKSGVVQSVGEHGVWVDIGAGLIGLLTNNQISQLRVFPEDIEKMFSVGDEIKVMVRKIYNDRQRIGLSTRSLEVNPGDMFKDPQLVYSTAEEAAAAFRAKDAASRLGEDKAGEVDPNLKVHELRSGVVQSVERYRVFVDIGAGPVGLLSQHQISHERVFPEDIAKIFSVGDEIKVMVEKIYNDRQGFSLSTKSLEVNPGDMFKDPRLVYEKAEE